jgi:predicted Zn-dependent protease
MEPRNVQAWEMMVVLAQERGNKPLLDAGMRALLDRNPDHFLQYQNAGVDAYRKGDLAKAEPASARHPAPTDAVLLNNLAHVITEQDGNLQDALKLINEALLRQPGQASMLSTRGAIYVKLGRFEEARQDLQESLRKQGRTGTLLLLLAQTYEGLGDRTRSLTAAKALAAELDKLEPKQRVKAKEVIRRLEAAPPPTVAPAAPPRTAAGRIGPGRGGAAAPARRSALLGARGALLLELGRHAEARQDLSASLRQLGWNADRLLQLARACEGLGDKAGAAKIAGALAAQPERLTAAQKRQLAELRQRLR